MARNTTRQGANFELDVMHELEKYGYTCLRSSGSRGAVDVVAVGPETGNGLRENYGLHPDVLFIQCKITNPVISPAERRKVSELALRARALPLVAFKAKHATTGLMAVHFRQLTGPGPKEWLPWEPEGDE
jgi:Holliday junction resolvase